MMGAVVRHHAPSMSSIVRTGIRTRTSRRNSHHLPGKHLETRDVKLALRERRPANTEDAPRRRLVRGSPETVGWARCDRSRSSAGSASSERFWPGRGSDWSKPRVADALRLLEGEFASAFPDCEAGALPPFGNLYDVAVYVDRALGRNERIVFQAGTHTVTMNVAYADFQGLARPTVADIAMTR